MVGRPAGCAVVVVAVLAGCKGKSEQRDGPSATQAPSAEQQSSDDPGVASDWGTRGERECFDVDDCESMCSQKVAGACHRLAQFVERGWGTEPDRKRAEQLRLDACLIGDAAACFDARPEGDDFATARAALDKACDSGSGRACYVLARWVRLARVRDEPSKPQPDGEDEFADDSDYEDDYDDSFDDEEAFENSPEEAEYDRKACEHGYAYSCEILVSTSSMDEPGPYRLSRNQARALDRKASELRAKDCDAGVAFACMSLAILGQPSRYQRALDLYFAQCEAGYPPSCGRAADLVTKGRAKLRRPDRAAAAWKRACALGATDLCEASSP